MGLPGNSPLRSQLWGRFFGAAIAGSASTTKAARIAALVRGFAKGLIWLRPVMGHLHCDIVGNAVYEFPESGQSVDQNGQEHGGVEGEYGSREDVRPERTVFVHGLLHAAVGSDHGGEQEERRGHEDNRPVSDADADGIHKHADYCEGHGAGERRHETERRVAYAFGQAEEG